MHLDEGYHLSEGIVIYTAGEVITCAFDNDDDDDYSFFWANLDYNLYLTEVATDASTYSDVVKRSFKTNKMGPPAWSSASVAATEKPQDQAL